MLGLVCGGEELYCQSVQDQQEGSVTGVRIRGDQKNHHLAAGIFYKGKGKFLSVRIFESKSKLTICSLHTLVKETKW